MTVTVFWGDDRWAIPRAWTFRVSNGSLLTLADDMWAGFSTAHLTAHLAIGPMRE